MIFPLACVHTLGNLFTNVSLGRVAVSFTHTIKVRHQQGDVPVGQQQTLSSRFDMGLLNLAQGYENM